MLTAPIRCRSRISNWCLAIWSASMQPRKDGHSEARTDISFIQVDPFEREFSQSQQNGRRRWRGGKQQSDGNFEARERTDRRDLEAAER